MAFEHKLAIRLVRKHDDGVTVEFAIREDFLNSNGVLHGGVIASIADEAAWHAMNHAYQRERPATTSELKINYLRPVRGEKMRARVYALRTGKTLFVSRIDLFDSQKRLAAVSVVTYILLDSK